MYRAAGYLQNTGTVGDYVNLQQFRSFPGFGLGAVAAVAPAPAAPYERVLMLAATLAASTPNEARLAAVVSTLGNLTPAHIGMAEVTGCQLVREVRQGKDPLTAVRDAVAYLEKLVTTSPAKELKTVLGAIATLDPTRTGNFETSALTYLLKGIASPSSTEKARARAALDVAIKAVREKTMTTGRAAQLALETTQPKVYGTKAKLVLTPGYQCNYGLTPAQQAEAAKVEAILAAREAAVLAQQQQATPPVLVQQPPVVQPVLAQPPVVQPVLVQTPTEQGVVLAPALPPTSAAEMTLEQLLAPQAPVQQPYVPPPSAPITAVDETGWSTTAPVVPYTTLPPVLPTTQVEENWAVPYPDSLPALPPVLTSPDQVVLDVPAPAEPPPLKKFPVVPVALATGGVVAAILLYRKFGTKK